MKSIRRWWYDSAKTSLGFGIILLIIAGGKYEQGNELLEKENRVNILFLMADQHRADYLGSNGNDWVLTPNLDKLANEGVNFINAYSSTPSCTPARTAIFTGLSPWNHGMLGYMGEASQSYECEMPSLFALNGYITHAIGKNHFGHSNTHGYQNVELEESWYSTLSGGYKCDYQKWFEKVAPDYDLNATGLGYTDHTGAPFPFVDSLHATFWTAERAIAFLKRQKNEDGPWFLKVSFQRPHPPFDPPKRWMTYYADVDIPLPKVGEWAKEKFKNDTGSLYANPDAFSGIFAEEEIIESLIAYAGGLSFVDEQIGRIIEVLQETGQYENSLILYTSDHGDMMGDNHLWRKTRPYEPSTNVPMIIRWPESFNINAQRGQHVTELVEMRDIFPTFAHAAGIEIPVKIDGENMLEILYHNKQWRKIIDLEHSRAYVDDNAWVALTDGRHKYIYFTVTGEEQLFDLQEDPHELIDLSQDPQKRDIRNEWYKLMVDHLRIRGPEWVSGNRLQILKESKKTSINFPGK
jgi:arylsulfatase A-like enzyme